VVLVEAVGWEQAPITAVAMDDAEGRVVLDTGASPTPLDSEFDVVASLFAADRFDRVTGVLRLVEPERAGLYELVAKEIEHIERRGASRRAIELPASLSAFDGPDLPVSLVGHTVDLSSGGCKVVTAGAFPVGAVPTVSLHLDGDETVLARAAILERCTCPEGYCYRLMFTDIELEDRIRIAELVAA
jgi:hypothetical protein